ncbi:MAG: GFA family protein [Pseudomonadota bacterium]
MPNSSINGSCLCQNVTYTINGHLGIFQYCHCSRCRKFTGSAFAANLLVAPEHFQWTKGADLVSHFPLAGAKHFATAFCKRCGSSLPWKAQSGKSIIIPAGTLDDVPDLKPFQNLCFADKASWFENPADLKTYDGMPPRRKKEQ